MLDEFQRDEALIHFRRGLILERANRIREAVEEYRRAIARNPLLREARDALGLYYQRHGLLAKAAEEFRVVADLDDDFLSHFNLACIQLDLGRYDEALAAFQRCLELEPGDPAACYEIGCIHFVRGDYPAALEQLHGLLLRYDDDWEIYDLIGRCQLRLGRYDEAMAAFERALGLAPHPAAQAEAIAHILTVERYREIGIPGCVKDQLYAEHGVVYLGSLQNDELLISRAQDYHFTYPDIGVTLQRLLALCRSCDWSFTCVVALDRLARPLAEALARLLGIPQRSTDELQAADLPLLVLAMGREAELLQLAIERIPCVAVTFCLGLSWLRHSGMLPDISGVITRGNCSVPWEPELRRLLSDGAPIAQVATCLHQAASQIITATQEAPADSVPWNGVRYYTQRRYLRFTDAFARAPL